MLENLTKKLIKDDIIKHNKELLIEGILLPTKMSVVERYSLASDCGNKDTNDIKAVLSNIKFDDMDTYEDRLNKIYTACSSPKVISEAIQIERNKDDKIKKLTMSQKDYDDMLLIVSDFSRLIKTDDAAKIVESKKKIKKFLATVNNSMTQADVADAFITTLIGKIFKIFCKKNEAYMKDNNKASVIANIRAISKCM